MENIPFFTGFWYIYRWLAGFLPSTAMNFQGTVACQGHDRVGLRAQRHFAPRLSTPPLVPWTQGAVFFVGVVFLRRIFHQKPYHQFTLWWVPSTDISTNTIGGWDTLDMMFFFFFSLSRWERELAICNQLAKAKQWVLIVQCYDYICKVKMIVESVWKYLESARKRWSPHITPGCALKLENPPNSQNVSLQ